MATDFYLEPFEILPYPSAAHDDPSRRVRNADAVAWGLHVACGVDVAWELALLALALLELALLDLALLELALLELPQHPLPHPSPEQQGLLLKAVPPSRGILAVLVLPLGHARAPHGELCQHGTAVAVSGLAGFADRANLCRLVAVPAAAVGLLHL